MDITRQLAQFIVNQSFSDIPYDVRRRAKYTIIDTLGCCIAGYSEAREECGWIINLIKDLGGNPESSVFMSGLKTSPPMAALANGTMIHSIDFDDTHIGSISHFSASLVPTVFSLGERLRADGPSLIEAFILGFEISARVGRQMMPSHYKFWHPTGTFGSLASAAASSKLLKLGEVETEYALGLAADQAAGLRYCIDKGDYSKSLHPGFAAMNGVMLALLVQKGANGPRGILEYPTGFCHAFSAEPRVEKILEGLGEPYELTSNSHKIYPTILISHSPVQAVLELIEEHNVQHSQILKVHVKIPLTAKGQGQNYHPETPLAARLSIPFCIALAAVDREISLAGFRRDRLGDPEINGLMGRIVIEEDTSLNDKYPGTLAAVVEMEIAGNVTLGRQVIYPKGSTKNPMTEDDITDKFRRLCSISITGDRCEEILEMLLRLDQLESVQGLFDSLRGD